MIFIFFVQQYVWDDVIYIIYEMSDAPTSGPRTQ